MNGGGFQVISSGGVAYGTKLAKSATQVVSSGGVASTTMVISAIEAVFSGGTATGSVVSAKGLEIVFKGGTATDTTIDKGGRLLVLPGADVTGTKLSGGQVISSGVLINGGGKLTWDANIVSGVYLNSDQTLRVLPGGSASFIDNQDGSEIVYSGGQATDDYVTGYNGLTVSSGGTATGDIVTYGAEYVSAGGSADGAAINAGGEQNVYSGASTTNTTLNSGTENVSAGGLAVSTTVNSGGTEYVLSNGSATSTQIVGGAVVLDAGSVVSGGISFTGTKGGVVISSTVMPSAVFSGFGTGDTIDLANVSYNTNDKVKVKSTGLVAITTSTQTFTLNIAGATVGETDFSVNDYNGSVELERNAPGAAAASAKMNFLRPARASEATADIMQVRASPSLSTASHLSSAVHPPGAAVEIARPVVYGGLWMVISAQS